MLYVNVTIDAEGVHGPDPYNNMMHGIWHGSGKEYGINFLVKTIRNFGIVPTVFFDIYEKSLFGEKLIIQTCESLLNYNVDLQLHTHPGWRIDKRDSVELQQLKIKKSFLSSDKDLMSKLTLEEQIDVIGAGKNFFLKHFGINIIAHRSGGYSMNEDTLKALKANQIYIDSSYNGQHKNTIYRGGKILSPCFVDEVLQIPITHFQRSRNGVLENKLRPTSVSTFTMCDLKYILKRAVNEDLFINYFLHSYSLIKFNKKFTKFKFSPAHFLYLREHLDLLSSSNVVKFLDMTDFSKGSPYIFRGSALKTVIKNDPFYLLERVAKKFL